MLLCHALDKKISHFDHTEKLIYIASNKKYKVFLLMGTVSQKMN